MNSIKEIYRVNYMKDRFSYAGTLRNERKFNLFDNVFFVYDYNKISRGKIVGIELPIEDNPDYLYKIQLPEWLVLELSEKTEGVNFYKGLNLNRITLKCDHIFNSIDEAKKSALENTEKMYELQKKEIENYFNQYQEKP